MADAEAHTSAVISSSVSGVSAVTAGDVLCAFCCVVETLPEHCLRRRARANVLVAAVFRTKRLLRERCSATCLRRRRPGQARRRRGRLQITADMDGLAFRCSILRAGTERTICRPAVRQCWPVHPERDIAGHCQAAALAG